MANIKNVSRRASKKRSATDRTEARRKPSEASARRKPTEASTRRKPSEPPTPHTATTITALDRNRSVSPPIGLSEVPTGSLPILSNRGKVIAWTRREWVLPLEEIALTTVTWVNDDGTVVRRALTPEDMPEKILERGADEGRILGFGEYGVPAGPGRLMNMAGWDYDGELAQENDNAEEEGWEIDESEWIGWVKWEECTGGDFRDLQV